jgi:hypothetical protein
MRHHQQYQRKQQSTKLNANDYDAFPTGGDDDQVRFLLVYISDKR